MARKKQTTEDLRMTLFDCIEKVKTGKMHHKDARAITVLADKVIQTAKLEMEYAETLSRLDKDGQGVSPGPMLLAQPRDE